MFAVPGWSVSSKALKTQTSKASTAVTSTTTSEATAPSNKVKHGRKRKRTSEVNSSNLAELWETVIEKRDKPSQDSKTETKRTKRSTSDANSGVQGVSFISTPAAAVNKVNGIPAALHKEPLQKLKEKERSKKSELLSTVIPRPELPTQMTSMKLTPLQVSMRQKLVSARFRHLNQTLYTSSSSNSLAMFQTSPEMFQEYHEGFRKQVEVWPENPVDSYVQQIRQRGKQRGYSRKGRGQEQSKSQQEDSSILPLPRTEGTCYIADLGCGDAKLSSSLEKEKRKLKLQILSYDLLSVSPLVTKADIASLPLEDGSVDVAIFCLALMGTNWIDFIEEAYRILHWKGELWVAEIKSRFARSSAKGKRVVDHSVGNKKKLDKKAAKEMEQEADHADLSVEVDGHTDNRADTDVSAFVNVLRKRGFELQSETAVDVTNKMFVKMGFVKSLRPVKGKCVPAPKGLPDVGSNSFAKSPKPKFIDYDRESMPDEAGVLKPCVYKLR